jgi:uncharacterized protein YuzB (UPF0349 family)
MLKIAKLVNGDTVLGDFVEEGEYVTIETPHAPYDMRGDGEPDVLPYDCFTIQCDIKKINVDKKNILYIIDMKESAYLHSKYVQATSTIIIQEEKKIIL